MNDQLITRLERAQSLVRSVANAAMATVNADGSPHNTPLFIAFSPNLHTLYWSSNPTALHSQNLTLDPRAYFVLFEPNAGGGLYIPVSEVHVATGDDLAVGLTAYNAARLTNGKQQPLLTPAFSPPNVQRLYQATVESFSVNLSERDQQGKIIRDYRQAISAEQLNGPAEDLAIY